MFTVTITKTTIEEKPAGKEWERTGEDNPKFAYTPEIVKKIKVELKIYEQIVGELDLVYVIEAVNKKDFAPACARGNYLTLRQKIEQDEKMKELNGDRT